MELCAQTMEHVFPKIPQTARNAFVRKDLPETDVTSVSLTMFCFVSITYSDIKYGVISRF